MDEEFWENVRSVFEDNDPFGMHESDLINHLKMMYSDEYEAAYQYAKENEEQYDEDEDCLTSSGPIIDEICSDDVKGAKLLEDLKSFFEAV
tara:strand:- start:119 stop:391 length:273 start_codon:yes stop_codon:yes gene_type:complete